MDCGKISEMASVRLYPILLSTEVLLPPPPINSFRVSFPLSGETLIAFGGLNIGRSSLQQREEDWRRLFCCISADGCLFGLPLQSLLLLIHSHLLVGAYSSEFGQEWFLPLQLQCKISVWEGEQIGYLYLY